MQEPPSYNDKTLSNVIYVIVDLFYDYTVSNKNKTLNFYPHTPKKSTEQYLIITYQNIHTRSSTK